MTNRISGPDWRTIVVLAMVGFAVTANLGDTIFRSVRIQHIDLMLAISLALLVWAAGLTRLWQALASVPVPVKAGTAIGRPEYGIFSCSDTALHSRKMVFRGRLPRSSSILSRHH